MTKVAAAVGWRQLATSLSGNQFSSQVPADLSLGLLFHSFRNILCCHLEGDEENNLQASLHANRNGNGLFRSKSMKLKD